MTRASIFIAIVLVSLNASAAVVTASGVGEDMGIDPAVGGDQAIADVQQLSQSLDPNTGIIESFVGMSIFAFDALGNVFSLLFVGPEMVMNLGVPVWAATFVFAPLYLIVFADGIYVIAGRLI
jgi:hypothetical protein